ncbi:MAG: lysophospholipid acyltransferase family protein [Phycisphaerae bacterium]
MEHLSKFGYRVGKFLTSVFITIFYRTKLYGKENIPESGGFLMICNHQSFLDPMFCARPIKQSIFFLAKDTLFKGLFGKLLYWVNTRPVKRGEGDLKAMRGMIEILKNGNGVCLFPEGTRSEDGRISDIKPGFILLCRRAKVPVLPIVVEGAYDIWPKGRKRPRLSGKVVVRIGKLIPCEHILSMPQDDFAAEITSILRTMQNESRRELGYVPYDY